MEKNELMGMRRTLCERSERATEKLENGSGRKFKILWIWARVGEMYTSR